jgi:predicted dinucleotide-binding enzyme
MLNHVVQCKEVAAAAQGVAHYPKRKRPLGGFQPVDAGPLKNARYLELLAGLNIWFGYGAGQGTAIAPAWIGRG